MSALDSTITATVLLALAGVLSCFLCLLVFLRNPSRRTHQVFAVLSFALALWAFGVLLIINAHEESSARFWIMATFIVSSFIPAAFYHFMVHFLFERIE